MNKCILKHNTVKSIPPPFACQIRSSKISDLGPLISFWPSYLPCEPRRWRQLAPARNAPSSCRRVLVGTRVPDPETCCASRCQPRQREEVLEETGDTVGLWPRQQSAGGGSTWRTATCPRSSNLLGILFGKRESQAVTMSGVKITLSKEHLWSIYGQKYLSNTPSRA